VLGSTTALLGSTAAFAVFGALFLGAGWAVFRARDL
jgi:hypothetical protein